MEYLLDISEAVSFHGVVPEVVQCNGEAVGTPCLLDVVLGVVQGSGGGMELRRIHTYIKNVFPGGVQGSVRALGL